MINIKTKYLTLIISNTIYVYNYNTMVVSREKYKYGIEFKLFNFHYSKYRPNSKKRESKEFIKEIYKNWIPSVNYWETKYKILFFNVYKLSRYQEKTKWSFKPVKEKRITKPIITNRYISQNEINEKYNNKWLVPINYTFDSSVN